MTCRWVTSYGWQCSCGATSFITLTEQADAVHDLDEHLNNATGQHKGSLLVLHTETDQDHDEWDQDEDERDEDYAPDWGQW